MTQLEGIMALLAAVLGMLTALVTVVWKARGWIDRLNTTDARLADAIENLARVQAEQHRENQVRFVAIEQRLGWNGSSGASAPRSGR